MSLSFNSSAASRENVRCVMAGQDKEKGKKGITRGKRKRESSQQGYQRVWSVEFRSGAVIQQEEAILRERDRVMEQLVTAVPPCELAQSVKFTRRWQQGDDQMP